MKKIVINKQLYASPSSTQGMGLFASEKIKKGDNLFIAFARADFSVNNENNNIFEMHFCQLVPNNYVNHSKDANVENIWAGKHWIVKRATRDIRQGEEIFSDYQKGMDLIMSKGYTVTNWLSFNK